MRWIKGVSIGIFSVSVLLFAISLIRFLVNRDVQAPVISMEQEQISVSVQDSEETWLAGITAWDDKDGDVTASLTVEYITNFVDDGERQVGIAAFDEKGNMAKTVRTIKYTDYEPPHFTLSSPFRFPTGTASSKIIQNLKAVCCLDSNVTRWIQLYNANGSQLNTSAAGLYKVVFSVSNSAGDVEKFQATIEIYDSTEETLAPKLALTDYMVYLDKGAEFDPYSYLNTLVIEGVLYARQEDGSFASVQDLEEKKKQEESEDGEEVPEVFVRTYDTTDVKIDNPVNTNVPGWYEVAYTVRDLGSYEKTARMLVRVREGRD